MTEAAPPIIVNIDDAEEEFSEDGHYAQGFKVLTPALEPRLGHLGVNVTRVPPGKTGCPFHTHALEDEVFYVLSGTGVLRYGDEVHRIRPGDCISCMAGTGKAHQIYNDSDEDLTYLAIGMNDANEICTYPDSGKVMVRRLRTVGKLERTDYMDSEPDPPRIVAMAESPDKASRS